MPVWFIAALLVMVASQLARLHQHDAASWLLWDYGGRAAALAVLAAIPSVRVMAFSPRDRRMSVWKIALWITGIALVGIYLPLWTQLIDTAFPTVRLGTYPRPNGWLYSFDLIFGLALVAFSEEIVFRRYAAHVLGAYLGDENLMAVTSALLFGLYHWWAGPGHVVEASIVGLLLMLLLQRAGVLWPLVLAHYLIDVVSFA